MGQHVDGVIAADPVRCSLPAAGHRTGDRARRHRRSTPSNVLQVLLRDAYLNYRRRRRRRSTRSTPTSPPPIFRAVGAGPGRLARRWSRRWPRPAPRAGIRIWSAHPTEQKTLAGTTRRRRVPDRRPSPTRPACSSTTGPAGKLDYYLTTKVTVEDLACTGARPDRDGPPGPRLRPAGRRGARCPRTCTGPGGGGLPAGQPRDERQRLRAGRRHARAAAAWTTATSPARRARSSGRDVQVVTSILQPGRARDLHARRSPSRTATVSVWTTPTLTDPGFVSASCP